MLTLMLRIFKPIFVTGTYMVFYNGFCVSKGITKLESKAVYAGYLLKKRCYWPKGIPRDLIDTRSQDK